VQGSQALRCPQRVRKASESSVHNVARAVVVTRPEVRVRLKGDDGGGVSEPLLNLLDRRAASDQGRGIEVPRIMTGELDAHFAVAASQMTRQRRYSNGSPDSSTNSGPPVG